MSLIPIFSPTAFISFSQTDTDFVDEADGAGNLTFSAISIGEENPGRRVFVGIASFQDNLAENQIITAVSIGGVSADLHLSNTADFARQNAAIASAAVPSGSTADVVVTFSGAFQDNYCVIAVYRVLGLNSATAFDTDSVDSEDVLEMSIDVPAGGFLVAAASMNGSCTTTGAAESIDRDGNIVASASGLSAETGRVVSFNLADSLTAVQAGVVASFR